MNGAILQSKLCSTTYQPKVPVFTGTNTWFTFINQFETVAGLFRWTAEQKRDLLLAQLSDEAADYAFELPPDRRTSFHDLVYELDRRFKDCDTIERNQRRFLSRTLGTGESVREYAADLRNLCFRAFPGGIEVGPREQLLLKQFFDGLNSPEISFQVGFLQKPTCLNRAVDLVEEYAHFKGDMAEQDSSESNVYEVEQLCNVVKSILPVLQTNCGTNQHCPIERSRATTVGKKAFDKSLVRCYACHEIGHFARECKSDSAAPTVPDQHLISSQILLSTQKDHVKSDIGLGLDLEEKIELKGPYFVESEEFSDDIITLNVCHIVSRVTVSLADGEYSNDSTVFSLPLTVANGEANGSLEMVNGCCLWAKSAVCNITCWIILFMYESRGKAVRAAKKSDQWGRSLVRGMRVSLLNVETGLVEAKRWLATSRCVLSSRIYVPDYLYILLLIVLSHHLSMGDGTDVPRMTMRQKVDEFSVCVLHKGNTHINTRVLPGFVQHQDRQDPQETFDWLLEATGWRIYM